ncbi:MAG: hypothetical protein B9S35_15045 [Opitutia bacterium Tous-C5TDCM]|nr:MAG: hypothetical protein B9S35_15045 [Opitutae bacterium Tous-C5TDCM]
MARGHALEPRREPLAKRLRSPIPSTLERFRERKIESRRIAPLLAHESIETLHKPPATRRVVPLAVEVQHEFRGNRPDRFAWRGNGDTRHFRVEYRDSAGALVSAAVRAGLYRTPERQPGDPSDWLRVIVTPERRLLVVSQRGRTVTLRKVHTVLLDASSVVDPSVRDGVSIRVETR